ncbi:MAG: LutC/YkgG family protein [Jatrophihabitans sp.]|uniref:LutC/YkgG family protein n=1 Tax=Jatrophihabitans sp. TaxID=1932789 RepID=UPI003F805C3E
MSARDEILARVRTAVADAADDRVQVDRGYRDVPPPADPVELFAACVADYRATVHHAAGDEVAAVLADLLAGATTVVPDGFPWPVTDGVPDTRLTPAELDRLDAVVTTAALGIAVTGTIVLDHGPGQGRRALTLVPDRHVCVITTEQIVADVPEAVAALDPTRPQTWISGPSATSDIELRRVEGVHGPRRLHVVIVQESDPLRVLPK